uniref:energy transducer TonB n=1 Tax=Desulfovibrio sp. TaxID=885 RepID=UPI003AB70DB5
EGDGPGGGGLNDVDMGQVMLAVRPNWSFTSATRLNLVCVVRVKVNLQGEVEKVDVTQSSGNAQYDSSAANAIWRTSRAGAFPPPPSEQYTELDLVFTLNELMGR